MFTNEGLKLKDCVKFLFRSAGAMTGQTVGVLEGVKQMEMSLLLLLTLSEGTSSPKLSLESDDVPCDTVNFIKSCALIVCFKILAKITKA